MGESQNDTTSIVRVGYDGRVHKTYCGPDREQRFQNEIRVLRELDARKCDFVPRILDVDENTCTIVTSNCGTPIDSLEVDKIQDLFRLLKESYGVVHNDPRPKNVTFCPYLAKFCLINFEAAEVLGAPMQAQHPTGLTWAGLTESGIRKSKNEDALSVFSIKDGTSQRLPLADSFELEQGNLIFAVSDGMGGHSGGDIASHMVVTDLNQFLPPLIGDRSGSGYPVAILEKALHDLHDHIHRYAASRPRIADMGATVVCGLFAGGELHFGHVGDSRLYRFRNGSLQQLTDDHSFVGKLLKDGKINERESRTNPRRNILTQAIGANCQYIQPQIGVSRVEKGDWYLICSDGLIDGMWDRQIEQEFLMAGVVKSGPEKLAANLLKSSLKEAGKDDTTLFVVRAE